MISEIKQREMFYGLVEEAFETGFGMSETEKEFLVKQTYGDKYVGNLSDWSK